MNRRPASTTAPSSPQVRPNPLITNKSGLTEQAPKSKWPVARMRRWSLAMADILAVGLGLLAASQWDRFQQTDLIWVASAIPIWLLIAKANNLYDRDTRRIRHSTFDELPALFATAAIMIVSVRAVTEVFDYGFPSATLLVLGAVSFSSSVLLRGGVRFGFNRISPPERTIIVGAGPKADLVARRLIDQAGDRLEVIGYMAPEEIPVHREPEPAISHYCGPVDRLDQVARALSATRVVIADDELGSKRIGQILSIGHEAGIAVTMVPANHETLGPQTELSRLGEVPMLDFHFSVPPRSTLVIKRVLDITVSTIALTISAPFLLMAAIAVKLDSKGPVFFRQVRVGKDGRKFTMIKLRTMVADAEEKLDELIDLDALDEPAFKIPNDPRITRTGQFLRRSSLDEVPQFINVLTGTMSLVGPRPEEEAVVALYDERQRLRLSVKPGLTGPMQVAGRGSLSFEERLALERDYLDNMTVSGDIGILLRTPKAVLKGDGAF